jgi:hypothetical protein
VLAEVGMFLGSLYRADLVARLGQGKLGTAGRAVSRRVRKKDLAAASSLRCAGSITRAAQDQHDLASRARLAGRDMLVAATGKLSARVGAPVGGWTGKVRRVPQPVPSARQDPAPGPARFRPGRCADRAGRWAIKGGRGRATAVAGPEQPGGSTPERQVVGGVVDPQPDVPR